MAFFSPRPRASRPPVDNSPIINEEADRILGRMTLQALFVPFALLILVQLSMPFVNMPHSRYYRYHQVLDMISVCAVLVVWYAFQLRLFQKRLDIGRDLVNERRWKEGVAALEPFDSFGQRFLDRTGEAHYLLALAFAGTGKKDRAEKCKQFVRKSRPGPWAAKLGVKQLPGDTRSPLQKLRGPVRSGESQSDVQQTAPKPPKKRPKRRF